MRKLFLFFILLAHSFGYVQDEGILKQAVKDKLVSLSKEVFQKTNIQANLIISNTKGINSLKQSCTDKTNHASILLSLKDKKLLVLSDLDLDFRSVSEYYYLKYGFLPTQGTILPILTQEKGEDLLEASMLNGFSELANIIASSKNVELSETFGDSNNTTIFIIRLIFYLVILIAIFQIVKNKFKAKK